MANLLISIITATYNADVYLQRLLDSIKVQDKNLFEFLIIDGGSMDRTNDIIRQNSDWIDFYISEPDKGIYDAWNKGVRVAKGNWVMFLGADDILLPNALNIYAKAIEKYQTESLHIISSRIEMIDRNGNHVRTKGWQWEWPKFLDEMTIAHPGALHSKKLFDEYGLFDIAYKITGDYELLLRPREKLRAAFVDKVLVKMTEGGASDSIAATKEHCRAAIRTGGANPLKAILNQKLVIAKFLMKKGLKKFNINLYLKR